GDIHDPHVPPVDALPQPGAERLGAGFLGREPARIGGRTLAARFRFAPLGFREDALHEAVAEPLQRLFYAAYVDDIVANPEDHAPPAGCPSRAARAPVPRRASLMSTRMRATAS